MISQTCFLRWICGGDCGVGRTLVVDITVDFIGCIFFSMGLILGWVLVSCGRGCDFACGGGFWTRCGWWVLLGRYIVLMCCVEK